MRFLNHQYFGGNQLKEVANPSVATDAATKGYVDTAIANCSGGGGGSAGQLTVTDDNNGNIGLSLTGGSQSLSVTDDNGNITLTLN